MIEVLIMFIDRKFRKPRIRDSGEVSDTLESDYDAEYWFELPVVPRVGEWVYVSPETLSEDWDGTVVYDGYHWEVNGAKVVDVSWFLEHEEDANYEPCEPRPVVTLHCELIWERRWAVSPGSTEPPDSAATKGDA